VETENIHKLSVPDAALLSYFSFLVLLNHSPSDLGCVEPPFSGFDNSLFKLNLSSMKWESISDASASPSPRGSFGFSWCDGGLYVFGGNGDQENGKCCHGNHIVIHAVAEIC
jgi:hypothetical protein